MTSMPYSCLGTNFPDPDHLAHVVPGFTAALKAEVKELVRQIPPAELAIQWDLSIENRLIWLYLDKGDVDGARREAARIAEPATAARRNVPGAC